MPVSVDEAIDRVLELEDELIGLQRAYEELQDETLHLRERLHWAEQRIAELDPE